MKRIRTVDSTGQEGGLACKYYCLPGANNESMVEKDVILTLQKKNCKELI